MSAYVQRKEEPADAPLSTRNAGKLSTYELRQELVRRDKLDIPEESINHRTMLQRLIQVLLEDEEKAAAEKTAAQEEERAVQLLAAKQAREQKKLEALERSRQRQQSAEYFEAKQVANVEPLCAVVAPSAQEKEENEEDIIEVVTQDDPFSSISSKSRNKIHTR